MNASLMIPAAALIFCTAVRADVPAGLLELVDQTVDGGTHYYEWEVEGTDLVRLCVRGDEDGNDWSILLPDGDDGCGYRRAFDFLPILLDGTGSWLVPHIEDVQGICLSEEYGQVMLDATFVHDLDPAPGNRDHPERQTNYPIILLYGEPDGDREETGWFWHRWMPVEDIATRASRIDPDVLAIPFEEFTVYFDRMLGSPRLSRDSVALLDSLEFELSLAAIRGNLSSTAMMIRPSSSMASLSVRERFSNVIFFGMDGSGGNWTQDSIPAVFSGWIELEEVEAGFETLELYADEFYAPEVPDRFYDRAREYVRQQGPQFGFLVAPQTVMFEIRAVTVDGEVLKKTLIFHCRPGD